MSAPSPLPAQQIEDYLDRLVALQQEVDSCSSNCQSSLEEMSRERKAIETENVENRKTIQSLRSQMARLTQNLETEKSKSNESLQHMQTLSSVCEQAKLVHRELEYHYNDLFTRYEELKRAREVANVPMDVQSLQQENNELRQQIQRLSAKNETFEQHTSSLSTKYTRLQTLNAQLAGTIAQYSKDLNQIQQQYANCQMYVQQVVSQFNVLQEELKRVRQSRLSSSTSPLPLPTPSTTSTRRDLSPLNTPPSSPLRSFRQNRLIPSPLGSPRLSSIDSPSRQPLEISSEDTEFLLPETSSISFFDED